MVISTIAMSFFNFCGIWFITTTLPVLQEKVTPESCSFGGRLHPDTQFG